MNNELATKTVKELRDLAKEQNIVGRWSMTKEELVNALSCVRKSRTAIDYLEDIKPGTLVAFSRGRNKKIVMSGKYVTTNDKGKIIVETKMGTEFVLSPDEIVWVRTGKRWPKWVYQMFNNKMGGDSDVPEGQGAQLDSGNS